MSFKKLVLPAALLVIGTPAMAQPPAGDQDTSMGFFITSVGSGNGADLGGLAGADAHCEALAEAAGVSGKTWRAYLSTNGSGGVDARDRIGNGPWYNADGELVARSLADLHYSNVNFTKQTALTEMGGMVNGRGDNPNQHDILTGSNPDGTASENTCENWTASGSGSAQVGHFDRTGGGAIPESWNSAHASRGCSQSDLQGTGGNGYYYCFAVTE